MRGRLVAGMQDVRSGRAYVTGIVGTNSIALVVTKDIWNVKTLRSAHTWFWPRTRFVIE